MTSDEAANPPVTSEPRPLPLRDQFDASGWTGATRHDDFFDRSGRVYIGPAMMLLIVVALASNSWLFRLAVALPILAGFAYFLIAYQLDHVQLRITRDLVTFSYTPLWLPTIATLPTAELRGFEVTEFKAWVTSGRNRFEAPLWEIIAVAGNDVLRPIHISLVFRQPKNAEEIAARLNWVLSRLRAS